jgi:hypothetical protein
MISSEKNEVLHYFFKKNQPFFKDIVRHFIVFQKKYQKIARFFIFSEEISRRIILPMLLQQ